MKTYLITYDLKKEGAAYSQTRQNILNALSRLGELLHVASTTYLLKTNLNNANQVFDASFKPYLDSNDRAVISQLCKDKSGWLAQDQWNWINQSPMCC